MHDAFLIASGLESTLDSEGKVLLCSRSLHFILSLEIPVHAKAVLFFVKILCIYLSVNIMVFQTLRSLIMRSKSV